MPQKLPNYIRAARREAGLSQAEVSFLLGCQHGSKVSRYERFVRHPNVATMFACAIIFRLPLERLFAGAHERATSDVIQRVHALVQRLSTSHGGPLHQRKLETLSAIANAAGAHQTDNDASV